LSQHAKFRVPYVNGKYLVVIGFIVAVAFAITSTHYEMVILEKPLLIVFWITWVIFSFLSFRYSLSLLPILGVLTNLYLMTELGVWNWGAFLTWLAIGLVIYLAYGYRKSKLAQGSVGGV
jgi:APA family basic amino acid/polyamine antiporter